MATTDQIHLAQVMQIMRIKGVGPATFWKIFNKSNSIEKTYNEFAYKHNLSNPQAQLDIILGQQVSGIECVSFWQQDYPNAYKNLHHAPPLLWYRGNKALFNQQAIAIVGGRNASFHGIRFAHHLSETLTVKNINIISGLARGIDTAAHKGAMSAKGNTIAVLAGGVDCLYPKENQDLYDNICLNHLVISEMPPGVEPTAELFPRRNRLIAGLTKGVCIIEAAIKSGSLITAHYALDMGLPIFACPGHPYDPRSRGCNQLIKQGAYVLESTEDVLEHLDIFANQLLPIENNTHQANIRSDDNLSQQILNSLSHAPILLEDLMQKFAAYPSQQILILLGELELKELIRRPSPNTLTLV